MKLTGQQEKLLSTGTYAQKQIFSKSLLMTFSHRKRFEFARRLVKRLQPDSLLDYGCGDGTFLIYCMNDVEKKIGYDLSEKAISANTERTKEDPNFKFIKGDELFSSENKYQMLTCMEVMEHCTPENIEKLKNDFSNLLMDNGHLVVSVPIETGGAVFIKQAVRTMLGWMKFGSYEYTEHYSFKDLFRMVFAGSEQNVPRNYYDAGGYTTCGHYAFNWMVLKKKLEENFDIVEQHFTPVPFLGRILNGQVWFVCKKKVS